MSPIAGLIGLVVICCAVVCLVGLALRKWRIAVCGSPGAIALAVWLFAASSAPQPTSEMTRVFGAEATMHATSIATIKPTFMDGHFIAFTMSPSDFEKLVRPQFSRDASGGVAHSHDLPSGWPKRIRSESAFQKDLGEESVILTYDLEEQRAFASVWYAQW